MEFLLFILIVGLIAGIFSRLRRIDRGEEDTPETYSDFISNLFKK